MTPGFGLALEFAKRFWPLFVIIPLVFTILIMRNTLTGRTAKLEAAEVANKDLGEANRSLGVTIEGFKQQRIDNDAIAEAVVAKIQSSGVRLTETRTIIEKAIRDDPNVRSWGAVTVPDGVRGALRSREVGAPAR